MFLAWSSVHAIDFGRPFGDHMVLPMAEEVPVWGSASPGAEVEVRFAEQTKRGIADRDGRWKVRLGPLVASADGRALVIRSQGSEKSCKDVLVGEVWFCSGQSNMDFPLARAVGGGKEATDADRFPAIRLCNLSAVPTGGRPFNDGELARLSEERLFEGRWSVASQKSAAAFSAVAWWAGKTIHRTKGVPVGLVDNSVGGSGAEAWLPRVTLESRDAYRELLEDSWMSSSRISEWARGRARLNLGDSGQVDHPFRPGFLFEAGVSWWRGFPLTGVLWYQGETNAEIHDDAWNERLITDLVLGWRKVLEQPELPFFMVQLPRIGGNDPLRQWWPQFREVQARAAGKLDGVELIVTEDLGWDSPDVHPPDKRPVGERLGKAVIQKQKE